MRKLFFSLEDPEPSFGRSELMSEVKIKGVADIVVLLDVSGSMQTCIDAVKASVATFIDGLSSVDANNESPIRDWRMKVCGYRDHRHDPSSWFVDNPFVRDTAAVQAQLAATNMQASGGGDEPESLLDGLFKLAAMEQAGIQEGEDPHKWRPRGSCARCVIFFTDATFSEPMTIPEAAGGGIQDVQTRLMASRIILCGFFPEWEGYDLLGSLDGAAFHTVARISDVPALAGLGKREPEHRAEHRAAQEAAVAALNAWATDAADFTRIMKQLAKTVQKSAVVETAAC
jgi:hypothetical protein